MKFPPQSRFKTVGTQDFLFKPHLRMRDGAWTCRYLDGYAYSGRSARDAWDACLADYALRVALSRALAIDA